ncbi:MAG TPA: aspartate aminotransferase family protein [Polyangiaceae bacterium]|nr:aspartate aminotransferase family protein [Polyangiaceae bacterium]
MPDLVQDRLLDGNQAPEILLPPPGPKSREYLAQGLRTSAPMGPPRSSQNGIVYGQARGVNVLDLDGNRFVDLAAGFGAMLLGHSHPRICAALQHQASTLLQALGDVYPSAVRLDLEQLLLDCCGIADGSVLLGLSGSDAVTAALKTALLATGKPAVIAFTGGYHGLGHAPLSLCGLRESYRVPFAAQLNAHVTFVPYPTDSVVAERCLELVASRLAHGDVGAIVVEPILGRGGCCIPPDGALSELSSLAHRTGALVIADEIWTGLGRAGHWLVSHELGLLPDLICVGKGLGGGLPVSACLGRREVMRAWSREPEVVHTATFAGAALGARTALTTLEILREPGFMQARRLAGERWLKAIARACAALPSVASVRGKGFMIGIDLGSRPGLAVTVMRRMLERGYIVSTGGGARDVIILTPAITIDDSQIDPFVAVLSEVLETIG